ncbi:MAG: class I SAM-dependent methyltransferase [Rhodobacteraceae bacterium]|nr:class I SAM-dependent methyltransferase [Paracoccaceae bacterium]
MTQARPATATSPFWDRIARKYAARPIGNMAAYEKTLSQTRAYLTPTDRVLEIGCGTASTALLLAPDVAQYTASDISAEMVAIGREKAETAQVDGLTTVQGTLGDPALGAGPFDAVLAFNLLHLMPDPGAEARKVHALLRPGGVFISKSACLSGWRMVLRPLIGVMQLLGKAPYVRFMSVAALERMIRDAGFEIVESNDPSGSVSGRFIVARKL